MSSVDDRIVNMQFNNKQFQPGVTQTQKSLSELEKSLAQVAKSKGLDAMSSSAQKVTRHFSAMRIAGIAAIATISSRATNAGINLVKSFTVDPIKEGLKSYAEQIQATQVILANTKSEGTKLNDVTRSLKNLQNYANLTVYNFSQMTQNIGRFTAAGVRLKPATAAIKGMANVAALSGANTQQMSSAMYQMSQALSSGVIRLQDWNSLSNANMAGTNIQKAIEETARTMGDEGKAMDASIAKAGNFRNSLQSGWLTARIYSKTMKIMGGTINKSTGKMQAFSVAQIKAMGYSRSAAKSLHQLSQSALDSAVKIRTIPQLMDALKEETASAYANVFKALFGNINQATKLFTGIHNIFENLLTSPINQFAHLLTLWNKMGGRAKAFKGIANIFKALSEVVGTVGKAFRDVFPPTKAKDLVAISKAFKNFTKQLLPSKNTLSDLEDIFGGIFAVLHIGVTVIKGVLGLLGSLFGQIFKGTALARSGVLDFGAGIGQSLKALDKFLTAGGKLTTFMSALGKVAGQAIGPFLMAIGFVIKQIGSFVKNLDLSPLQKEFNVAKSYVDIFVADVQAQFNNMSGIVQTAKKLFGEFVDETVARFNKIVAPVKKFVQSFSSINNPLAAASSSIGGLQAKISNVPASLSGLKNSGANAFDSFKANPKAAISSVVSSQQVASGLNAVKTGAVSAQKAVSAMYVSFSNSNARKAVTNTDNLTKIANRLSDAWDKVKAALAVLGKGIVAAFEGIGKVVSWIGSQFAQLFGGNDALQWASLMNALFTGVLLHNINKFTKTLSESISGIGEGFKDSLGQLTSTLKTMQQAVKAKAIEAIAIAVALLVASVIALSFVNPKKLGIALGAISIMLGELVASLKLLSSVQGETNFAVLAGSILLISAAMVSLASAVAILGHQDLMTLAKGLGAAAIGLAIMTKSLQSMGELKASVMAGGAAMILMAVALNALALATLAFGKMKMSTLAKGLGAMAIALAEVTLALEALGHSDPKSLLAASVAVLAVSAAMTAFSASIAFLGHQDLSTLAKGLGAFSIVMAEVALTLGALGSNAAGTAAAALAILAIGTAMTALSFVVKRLGGMSVGSLIKGIGAMAAVLLILGGIGAALAGPLAALGSALILFGGAMALAGVGMLAFSTGFALLAAVGVAGAVALGAAFSAIMALLPAFAVQVAAAFVSFVATVAAASGKLRKSFDTIFQNILGVISDNIPKIAALFQEIVHTGLEILGNKRTIKDLINVAINWINGILSGIKKEIPKFAKSAADILIAWMDAFSTQIPRVASKELDALVKMINGLADAIRSHVKPLRQAGINLLGALLDGLTFGLSGKMAHLAEVFWDKLKGVLNGLWTSAKNWFKHPFGIGGGGSSKSSGRILAPSALSEDPSNAAVGRRVADAVNAGFVSAMGDGQRNSLNAVDQWANALAKAMAKGIGKATVVAVKAATRMSNAVILASDPHSSQARKLQAGAVRAQQKASSASGIVRVIRQELRTTSKKDKKARAALQHRLTRAQHQAEAAQKAADNAAQRVQDQIAYDTADNATKAQTRDANAVSMSNRANELLKKAQVEAAQGRKLLKTNKKAGKALIAQSKADAKAAKNAAAGAQKAHKEADRLRGLDTQSELKAAIAQNDAQKNQEVYDKADTATKISMMNDAVKKDKMALTKAKNAQTNALANAKKYVKSNKKLAQKYLDQYDKATTAFNDATSALSQDQSTLSDLSGSTPTTTGGVTVAPPSRSILDDASKAVDHYTASMLAAENAAGAAPALQFVQNNMSPKALSPTEIYRKTNNLLSAAEIKMGL